MSPIFDLPNNAAEVIAAGVPLDGWTKGAPIFVTHGSQSITPICDVRDHDVLSMDGEQRRYVQVTRFGDIDCEFCGMPLGWSPALVREGLYSEDTSAWIAGQVAMKVAALV